MSRSWAATSMISSAKSPITTEQGSPLIAPRRRFVASVHYYLKSFLAHEAQSWCGRVDVIATGDNVVYGRYSLLAIFLVVAIPTVQAQVYRCQTSKGTTYQQTPCQGNETESRVRVHAAPSEATQARARARLRGLEALESERRAARMQMQTSGSYSSVPPAGAGEPYGSGSSRARNPCEFIPSGQRIRRAECEANQRLAAQGRPSLPPRPRYDIRDRQGPSTVRDTQGREYQRPAGSHFVTDPQTGRQCYAPPGSTVLQCN